MIDDQAIVTNLYIAAISFGIQTHFANRPAQILRRAMVVTQLLMDESNAYDPRECGCEYKQYKTTTKMPTRMTEVNTS